MKLRDYEKRSVSDLLHLLRKHRRVIAVGPTGCGKTVIGAALIRAMRGRRVLWLAHRVELLKQAREQLLAAGLPARDVGIMSGSLKENESARVLVAGVGMFQARAVPRVELIVVDEAHHVTADSYRSIVDAWPKVPVLGLTATPQRLDGEPLGDVFAHLYEIADTTELVADGYLLQAVVYGIPREQARALVRGLGGAKEYSAVKLEKAMKKRPLMADIIKERERLARGQRTLVYACTRAHGKALLTRFKKARVASAYLDAMTPASERADILKRLRSKAIQVVVNVGVLTEGFDCPPVSCIVVARPTKSLVLWRQMCGRGARPSRGKRYLVLDHAGNIWRHGFPDKPMDWSLGGHAKATGGEAPMRICPECSAVIPAGCLECPECGAEMPASERTLDEREAEMQRIKRTEQEKTEALKRIRKVAAQKGASEQWVQKVLGAMFAAA